MAESVSDFQSAGSRLFREINISTGQSEIPELSLHDDRSDAGSERLAPDGQHLNTDEGEDSEENGNLMRPRRVAVQFEDGSAMDEHVKYLTMYFQTVQPSGGSRMKCHRLSYDKKTLFITFEKDITQKLLETQHEYKSRCLTVTVLEPGIEEDGGCQCRAFGMSLGGKDEDFMKIATPCLLNYLKEIGVEYTTTAYNRDQNCWLYTVKSDTDVERIFDCNSNEATVTFDGMTLTLFKVTNDAIEPRVDGPEEAGKLLVTHLPPGVTEQELKLFLEQNSGNTVANIQLQAGKAMLTLEEPFDFPSLVKAVHTIPLKGYMLSVQKVPLSLAILVSSNGKELDEEDLRITFNYYAQECTGNTTDRFTQEITVDKQKKRAIVKFFKREVLTEILTNCEAIGTLSLYHECMTDEQHLSTSTPNEIESSSPSLNPGF